jgi:2-polyprenyl-3-methyl-5-hydroxy-6-metoxy-1,4-benzoquinol methylase
VRCPACDGLMVAFSVGFEEAVLERCRACGHAVTLSSPTHVTYDDYGSSDRAKEVFDRHYLGARTRSYERGLGVLGEPTGGKLLDYGANYGHFVAFAVAQGWEAHGYEPGRGPRELAVRGAASRLVGTLDEAATHAPFDVVTFWDVLEHLASPINVLGNVESLLCRTGRIVVRVPDATAFVAVRQAAGRLWGGLYLKLCHPTNPEEHVHHFTPQSLELIARAAGFLPQEMIQAAADERVAAGRTVLDGALRKLLHRWGQSLPYEFTLILSRQ